MRASLIVGASRGLGLVLVGELLDRGWAVVATTRAASPDVDALAVKADGRLDTATVDITNAASIAQLRAQLDGRRFDLVFVNAGVNRSAGSIAEAADEEFVDVLVTNALGPIRVLDGLRDLVAPGGTVGVMSSDQGSIARNDEPGFEVYKASKSALNQLTRSYANRHAASGHTTLLIDPGHNRTDLGGPDAPLAPGDSIPLVVDVIENSAGRGGLQFLDRFGAQVPW